MTSCKTLILEYSTRTNTFGIDDLWNWISTKAKYSRNTVTCLLYRLVETGNIIRVEKGRYAKAANKTVFKIEPTNEEIALVKKIKDKYPFAPLCIYNGAALSPLQHHLSANNITYIETDRSAVESIFNYLREDDDKVWWAPDSDFVYKYIDLAKGGLIVKPLVTESPVQTVNGVTTPTLEKLLVDITKDPDFTYLQGTEAKRMFENADSMYVINKSRLNRYARRRGIKQI